MVILDIYLFIVFIKSLRSRNIKVYVVNTKDKVNVKGYTKTAHAPVDDEKMDPAKPVIAPMKSMQDFYPKQAKNQNEEAKMNKYKEDASFEAMNNEIIDKTPSDENDLKPQEHKLTKSYCSSYCSTILKKQRFISPLLFSHPQMSYFSRGLALVLSLSLAFLIPTSSLLVLKGPLGVIGPVILSFVLMRLLSIPMDSMLYRRHLKLVKRVQIGLVAVVIIVQAILLFIASMLDKETMKDLNANIFAFLVLDLVLYELFIHIFHVKIARSLVKNPTKLNSNIMVNKYFLSPIVYNAINDSS